MALHSPSVNKRKPVGIGGAGIKYFKGWQFDAFSPATVSAQALQPPLLAMLPQGISDVESWRPGRNGAIFRLADVGDVGTQTTRDLQFASLFAGGECEAVLGIEGNVVHPGQFVIAVLSPRRGITHIVIIQAAPLVACRCPFGTSHDAIVEILALLVPFGFALDHQAHSFVVIDAFDIPVSGRTQDDGRMRVLGIIGSDVISCFLGMYLRL